MGRGMWDEKVKNENAILEDGKDKASTIKPKVIIHMAEDFDAPLDDFKNYME